MDNVKRFVLLMRLRRCTYSVVQQCAIYARLYGLDVKRGWAISNGEACRHYWVEGKGAQYDIGKAYAALFAKDLADVDVTLSDTVDDGLKILDPDETNDKHYDMYVNDPKSFWKMTPSFKLNKDLKTD